LKKGFHGEVKGEKKLKIKSKAKKNIEKMGQVIIKKI